MKTAIVTDTNSGITVEEGRQSGIFVLPMPVIIEEHCYLEGVDITNEDLYQAMTADKNLSSSQPSPGDVMDLWNRVLESGYDEIVHIPMSSGLSGSCQTRMRNIVAHSYGTVDPEVTWEILTEDIPKLKAYCHQIISEAEPNDS